MVAQVGMDSGSTKAEGHAGRCSGASEGIQDIISRTATGFDTWFDESRREYGEMGIRVMGRGHLPDRIEVSAVWI